MIVAGTTSNSLKDFMVERGTFEVPFCYESLSRSVQEIKNSIIKVDKFLYLFQAETMSIRSDMKVLKELLAESAFFETDEIIFMVGDDDSKSNEAIRYFKSVMDSTGYKNFVVKKSNGVMTYANIYDQLLGVSQGLKFKNRRKNVYRVENANESKRLYNPELTLDMLVEPFNDDNLVNYERAKENAKRTESGKVFVDHLAKREKFTKPTFGQADLSNLLHGNKVACISGISKSGVTTWSCALAVSASDLYKSVLVLDYTNNQDVKDTMSLNRIKFTEVFMKDLLKDYDAVRGEVYVCSLSNERESKVKLEFLQNLFSRKDSFDYVFVVLPLDLLEVTTKIVGDALSKVIVCTTVIANDIRFVNSYLEKLDKEKILVIPNDVIRVMDREILLEGKECKNLLTKGCRVLSPITFKDLHISGDTCARIFEV